MIHRMRFGKISLYGIAAFLIVFSSCGLHLQVKPLASAIEKADEGKAGALNKNVVFRFFDEDFVAGGYSYVYPEALRVFIPEESGHESEVSLQFDLVPADYSGGAVCLYNLLYDMTPYYATGALEFWIKGNEGGEIAQIALADDEKSDGKKTVVRVPLNNYGGITKEWRHVSIPLADFGKRGVYWDEKKRVEIPNKFDWDQVAEFRMEIKKGDNKKFRAWVDDIFICKDVYQPRQEKQEEYWDDQNEIVASPPLPEPAIKPVKNLFKNDFPSGGFVYVYGGKSAYKIQKRHTKDYPGVLALYEDNTDYSGVTLALGKGNNFNIEPLRKAKAAGLGFSGLKAAIATTTAYIGLLYLEADGKKVQSKLMLGDFGKLDTASHYFIGPLRRFLDKGKYWDDNKKAEMVADVDWKQINETRFSTNKGENKVEDGQPVRLYVEDMAFIESIPGYVDPDEYWAAFKSSEPRRWLFHDFETPEDQTWDVAKGPKSEAKFEFVKSTCKNGGQSAGHYL